MSKTGSDLNVNSPQLPPRNSMIKFMIRGETDYRTAKLPRLNPNPKAKIKDMSTLKRKEKSLTVLTGKKY